jgi:hypothetical protein
LILLKAQIINDGDNDIDKNQVVLISSKEFSWLEIKVITKQKYPKSAIKLINENEVQIEWDLLKSGELIEFEAIVKVSDKISEDGDEVADFLEGITFDHRIKDLKKVLIGDIPTRKRSDIVFACIIMALGVYIFIESFFPTTEFDASKHFIEYNICNDSASTTIGISIKDREEIALYYPMEEKEETLSIDDFNERFKINHIEKINKHNKEESPLSVRIFGLCFVLLGSWFLRKRK